jgi:hypothetical protein
MVFYLLRNADHNPVVCTRKTDIVSARPTVSLFALGSRAPIDQYPADK